MVHHASHHQHPKKRAGVRTPVKQNEILGALRRQIVEGIFPPGAKLPLRSQLQEHFQVSTATVQGALNRLIEDGFVQAQGRLGTRVTENPPHLCHYALIFPKPPSITQIRSRFWTALSNEAAQLGQAQPRKVPIYYGVDGHSDTEISQKLLTDMHSHRLAGLIFAFPEEAGLGGTPLLEEPGMPRVAVTTQAEFHHLPVICLDMRSFIDRSLDYLASRGRRRIALLTVTGTRAEHLEHFNNAIKSRKLTTKPYWVQCVGWPETQWARNVVQLLLHDDQTTRPDGLIIMDDNIVEYATAGLVGSNVSVPGDVEVVAHCNFPWSAPSVLPIKNLGYDARQVLKLAIDCVDRERRGQSPPKLTKVPAIFEEELAAANSDMRAANEPLRGSGKRQ